MKKAFSLFELLIVLFISSIVLVFSFKFAKQLQESQIKNQEIAILKIDLNSTKIFIERNISNIDEKLSFDGNNLYYADSLLLKNVSSFSSTNTTDIKTINITLDKKLSQTWKFKK